MSTLEGVWQDLRYAARGLRKNPGFAIVAICCLALGIGANTAIFSLMNAVLLKSLPVENPEQLVLLRYVAKKGTPERIRRLSSGHGDTSLSTQTLEQLRAHSESLSSVFGFVPLGFNKQSVAVTIDGKPSLAGGEMVTGEYFSGLGVSPVLGRPITRADENPGAANVAVISYGYWVRQFARDASITGRTMALNATPFTIIGVTPPEFFGVDPELAPDFWIPLRDQPGLTPWGVQPARGESMFADKRWWWLMIMGRRRPGVTAEQARLELDVLFQRSITAGLNPLLPPDDIPHIELIPAGKGLNFLRERFSKPLFILMTGVGLVLLIACANVATLLLARAAARRKEMGVRLAAGASRLRLIRQLLTESIALAALGGALGLLFAQWGSRILLSLMSRGGQMLSLDVQPDGAVLAFSGAVCVLTGVLFGLMPAFRATSVDLAGVLKESASTAPARPRLGRALVAGQVAFSVLLLIGSGLFIRTLQNLEHQDLGFDRRNVLMFALDPRRAGHTSERTAALFSEILEKLETIPGVRSATASQMALLSGWTNNAPISTDGPPIKPGQSSGVYWNGVGPGFFETMGIPLIFGRGIDWRDVQTRRRVAVVNEALARRFFPAGNPLGRRFNFGSTRDPREDYEIVGVVRNARYDRVRGAPPRTVYLPYSSRSTSLGRLYFELRTRGDPAALIPSAREMVRSCDPDLPLVDLKTQSEQIQESLAQERMFAQLCSFFGAVALLLVSAGVYGTLAYAVTLRTSEIGIRMALGASRAGLRWMVLRESLLPIGFGVLLGLPAALIATRLVASMLYGVQPDDVATIAGTILILAGVGALAGYLPARRASRVDPMVALRYE